MSLPPGAPDATDAQPSPAEPRLSATTRLVDRNGIEWELTLRAGAEGKAFVAFLDVLAAAGAYALAHGFALPATER